MNSLNPHRLQGQKTAAFEIVEELGGAPDLLTLPYGGGGNTRAYALGFDELGRQQRIVSAQSATRAETLASAIRIVTPAHRAEAEEAAEIVTVNDEQILTAWHDLAALEGLFCEPSSAAGIAGLRVQRARAGLAGRLRDHRPRPQGPGHGRPHGAGAGRGRARRRCDRGGRRLRYRA